MEIGRRSGWLAINFAATIFVSAFLLFQVQPLVSKYILPWFGGSPAVWTTCMLFFQTLLFGGYAYAHLSQRLLKPRMQGLVHLILIVIALLMLHVVPAESWKPEDSTNPVGKILLLLTATVGMPYFVLSSTGPLIQAWFAQSFPGKIPYRLYALSNVGSLLALLSYPFLFERVWDVRRQAGFWSWGFVAYAVLCGYAAISMWKLMRRQGDVAGEAAGLELAPTEDVQADIPIPWTRWALWLLLPAFASVVLLATTNHVSTDVAPMPFLWVVPLSLYLLTFIVAFDHPRWYRPGPLAVLTLLVIYFVALVYSNGMKDIDLYSLGLPGKGLQLLRELWAGVFGGVDEAAIKGHKVTLDFMQYVSLNFAAMFGICMLCHGELVRLRPHPKHLTAYFLMIAAGGAIGGAAVTLLAPAIFKTFFEFKLSLFAGYVLAIVLLIRSIFSFVSARNRGAAGRRLRWVGPAAGLVVLFFAGIGLCDLPHYFDESNSARQLAVRNFFGTLSVIEHDANNPKIRDFTLKHGSITHGLQFTDEERRQQPTTYYGVESGVGRTLGYFRQRATEGHGVRLGAVGLGTGTLAAYLDNGDSATFYEINPAVIEITEPGHWFTYLQDCKERGATYQIKLGDARLTLEREAKEHDPERFQVLVLDAFSGDAIPVHLLTEEAFRAYLERIATAKADGEDGAIAVHISNRYLDLEPVVRGVAEEFGLKHVRILNTGVPNDAVYASDWIILTNNEKLLETLRPDAVAAKEESTPGVVWTDSRSNLFDVLK